MMTKKEQRAKHAAYMREYSKVPVVHRKKILRDREYREKNLASIQAYDRLRNKSLERRAAKYVYGKNMRASNGEKVRKYHDEYYRKNKKKWQEKAAKLRARFTNQEWKDIQSRYGLKFRHGMTPEQYQQLLKAQNNKCALCSENHGATGREGKLHVDHDHTTGRNRALLCMRCNMAMERVDRCVGWIDKVINYLKNADAEKILGAPTYSRDQREKRLR